jgi:hypothetical protein
MPKGMLKVHKSIAKRLGTKASGDLGDVSTNVFNNYGGLKAAKMGKLKDAGTADTRFHLMGTKSPRAYLTRLDKDDD